MIIDFTGGNVFGVDGTFLGNTDEQNLFFNVGSYVESDFLIQYNTIGIGDGQTVGNYYGDSNDVLHGHWDGELQSIEISHSDNAIFDFEFLALTSNTEIGGSAATGNEEIYIEGFDSNLNSVGSFLIPSEDWGGEFQGVYLGDAFNDVSKVTIAGDGAFCYGMDSFVIDQQVPEEFSAYSGQPLSPSIPETSESGMILGLVALMLCLIKRKSLR
jgi:hypothetical protein